MSTMSDLKGLGYSNMYRGYVTGDQKEFQQTTLFSNACLNIKFYNYFWYF